MHFECRGSSGEPDGFSRCFCSRWSIRSSSLSSTYRAAQAGCDKPADEERGLPVGGHLHVGEPHRLWILVPPFHHQSHPPVCLYPSHLPTTRSHIERTLEPCTSASHSWPSWATLPYPCLCCHLAPAPTLPTFLNHPSTPGLMLWLYPWSCNRATLTSVQGCLA